MIIFFLLTGLLLIALAIPMILHKVPPNRWYGFRVSRTLNDPAIWYPANAYAGKLLFIYGLVVLGAAFLIPRLFGELSQDGLAILMSGLLLGGILIVLLLSMRFLRSI